MDMTTEFNDLIRTMVWHLRVTTYGNQKDPGQYQGRKERWSYRRCLTLAPSDCNLVLIRLQMQAQVTEGTTDSREVEAEILMAMKLTRCVLRSALSLQRVFTSKQVSGWWMLSVIFSNLSLDLF